MGTVPEWRWLVVIGFALVGQTLFDIAPEGPWGQVHSQEELLDYLV